MKIFKGDANAYTVVAEDEKTSAIYGINVAQDLKTFAIRFAVLFAKGPKEAHDAGFELKHFGVRDAVKFRGDDEEETVYLGYRLDKIDIPIMKYKSHVIDFLKICAEQGVGQKLCTWVKQQFDLAGVACNDLVVFDCLKNAMPQEGDEVVFKVPEHIFHAPKGVAKAETPVEEGEDGED